MDTATREPAKPTEPAKHVAPEVEAIDPENEINTKATVFWLVTAFVFVPLSLVVLAAVFNYSVRGAQYRKVDLAPTEELRLQRSTEYSWLTKTTPTPESDTRSLQELNHEIQQVTNGIIRNYVNKK